VNRKYLFLLILLICRSSFSVYSGETVLVREEISRIELSNRMDYMETPKSRTVEDILTRSETFKPWTPEIPPPADGEGVYWFRIVLQNTETSASYRYILIPKGYFWRCSIYESTSTGTYTERESFNSIRRPLSYHSFSPYVSFPISIPGETSETVFLRVSAYDPAAITPFLLTTQRYRTMNFIIFLIAGVLLGTMVGVLVYTIGLTVSLKEKALVYFLVFQIVSILYILFEHGLWKNLFPRADFRYFEYHFVPALSGFVILFLLLFSREFFQFKWLANSVYRVFTYSFHVIGAVLLLSMIPWQPLSTVTGLFREFFFYLMLPVILGIGIIAVHRKIPQARGFFIIWLVFLSGIIVAFLPHYNIRIPFFTFAFMKADQLTLVFLMLSLTATVMGRVKLMRKEKTLFRTIAIQAREESREKERLNNAKSVLMTAVSHELRTPISALRLPLEGIIEGKFGNHITANHEVFSRMLRQTHRITLRVENLLEYARGEFGLLNPNFQQVAVNAFLTSITGELKPLAAEKNIQLIFHPIKPLIYIEIDPDMMESALVNIIENSIKFSPTEGRINIRYSHIEEMVEIMIDDTGPGIPENYREKVFNPFTRNNDSTDNPGIGLGLSLTRDILSAHGGTVYASENPEGGARFVLRIPGSVVKGIEDIEENRGFPQSQSFRRTNTTESMKADRGGAKTVLIVEDDQDMMKSLKELMDSHYTVKSAVNGRQALCLLSETNPDLIITDIMMKEMNGIELLEIIRKEREYTDIPVIVLTAKTDFETELKGLRLGSVDYIRKPVSGTILLQKMRNILTYREGVQNRYREDLISHIRNWDGNRKDTQKKDLKRSYIMERFDLTKRQMEVLDLIIKGYTNKEIAEIMGLSPRTIENHVSNLLIKFGVERRTQLSYELGNNTHHNE
jgi:signal transduction histidine kinase/DNA-binding NarL/FixJ family response regulator